MVFSSTLFLVYFLPAFLLLYYLTPKKLRNYTLLVFSLAFYAWGAPKFVFILVGSTIVTFYIVKTMSLAKEEKRRKIFLVSALLLNIGVLLYFKYANFFVENFNDLIVKMGGEAAPWTAVVLPIGISFFTFQCLSYCLDVYRKVRAPLEKATDFLLYIVMFPQLIAGPIVRFNTIADQITNREAKGSDRISGFYRFVIGLAKKVLIANVMGHQADIIMAMDPGSMSSTFAWIGLLAYSFQIYFDFAGYSDMAIGIGRMLGFTFPENFNNPYISTSITEFWRRWHMTLSSWMRDYLYIPLGGSRVKTQGRLFFNLWVVFLISGLWHGASWNFVIWGAYHGLFLVLDRLFLKKLLDKIGKVPATFFTFLIAILGWVVFRLDTFPEAMAYYKRLFAFDFGAFPLESYRHFIIVLPIAIFFSFITIFKFGRRWEQKVYFESYTKQRYLWMGAIIVVLFFISLGSITSTGFNPFIYFRF